MRAGIAQRLQSRDISGALAGGGQSGCSYFETAGLRDQAARSGSRCGGSGQGGQIVRHLASGVLGQNAPEPFQWNSRKQVLVWDGKNDKGEYLEPTEPLIVRVSLGLKPRMERTLFWSPHKRISQAPPLMKAVPEGVYVFEGMGADHLRLFDHDGRYLRTIYPFAADKLAEVRIPLTAGGTWSEDLTSADRVGP
ncbi:MAG: hypothetical protein ACUVWX_07285 [Kiritimatiellia bacterium]